MTRHSHCSYCGTRFTGASWPRTCAGCANVSYLNPIPVAVCLLPVDGGLLVIRRGIEPQLGRLALPGGFIDGGETWQAAAARELYEETGITIDAAEVTLFSVHSVAERDLLLLFALARPRRAAELPAFVTTNETTERLVIDKPTELAFVLHTQAAAAFFRGGK